jgi:hypothetical protein
MRYRDNMTDEELAAFDAECAALDAAYAGADAFDAASYVPAPDECEDDDPVRMGWVGKDGRP